MRLDKFLKLSRVIKRRTVANEACDMGRVTINGKVAKASTEVNVGDEVEIRFGQNTTKFVIENIYQSPTKEQSINMVKIL
jgi:ribosomal 50S subunit-recycling heat shock protein